MLPIWLLHTNLISSEYLPASVFTSTLFFKSASLSSTASSFSPRAGSVISECACLSQGLIQWGGQRGHGPPSWCKMPQILGQMPSKSGQNAPICINVPHEFGQNALHLSPECPGFIQERPQNSPFRGQIFKIFGGRTPRPPYHIVKTPDLPLEC